MEYFGIAASNRTSDQAFSRRGLYYKRLTEISESPITFPSFQNDFNQGGLSTNLAALISSSILGHPCPVTSIIEDYFQIRDTAPLPLSPYNIVFSSKTPILADHMGSLSKVFLGPMHKNAYIVRNTTVPEFEKVFISIKKEKYEIDIDIGFKSNGMSVKGVMATQTISRLVVLYLGAQVSSTAEVPIGQDFAVVNESTMLGGKKTKPVYDKISEVVSWGEEYCKGSKNIPDGDSTTWFNKTKNQATDTVVTPQSISEEPCHIFHYFPGQLPKDVKNCMGIVRQHFARLFSANVTIQERALLELENGLQSSLMNIQGETTHHQLLGVHFAIITGGALRLIFSGTQYLGFQLCTTLPIIIDQKLREPIAPTDIAAIVSELQTGGSARDSVAAELSEMPLVGTSRKEKITGKDLKTSVALVEQIKIRQRLPPSKVEALGPALRYLSFDGETTSVCTAERIIEVFEAIKTQAVLPLPVHVTPALFTEEIHISANLSVFGPKSISFINTGGKKRAIYGDVKDDPLAKTKKQIVEKTIKKKGQPPMISREEVEVHGWPFIRISRVDIDIAIKDLRVIQTEKAVYMIETEDAKLLGNVQTFKLDKGSGPLLTMLRGFCGREEEELKRKKVAFVETKVKGDEVDEIPDADLGNYHLGF